MAIDIGRVAYKAFYMELYPQQCEDGRFIKWEDIGQREQNACRHAAVAVLQHIRKEQENLSNE